MTSNQANFSVYDLSCQVSLFLERILSFRHTRSISHHVYHPKTCRHSFYSMPCQQQAYCQEAGRRMCLAAPTAVLVRNLHCPARTHRSDHGMQGDFK